MKLDVSLEEILVLGSTCCAIIIALGMSLGRIPVLSGGAIIVSLCGGAVVVKVLKEEKNDCAKKAKKQSERRY